MTETDRQQKWTTKEALRKGAVHSVLLIQKSRELWIPCSVNQREFPMAQFVPSAEGCGLSDGSRWKRINAPFWIHLELGNVVNRAQQSGCDRIGPPAPDLGDAWVPNLDVLVCVHRCSAVTAKRKIFLWDEFENVVLDAFCVRLFGLVCNRLGLKLC